MATLLSRNSVLRGLTSDAAVQAACLSIFPMVMACQVNKGACVLAFVVWYSRRGGGRACPHTYALTRSPPPQKNTIKTFLGLAYPVNGIIMGGLDWTFSTVTMWLANFVCIGLLLAFQPATLNGLWAGACCCFGWMVLTVCDWRKTGAFRRPSSTGGSTGHVGSCYTPN